MHSPLVNPREFGRSCMVCGGGDFDLLHWWEPEHPRNSAKIPVGYWECRCRVAFMDPIPTAEQLPAMGDWWSPERKMVIRNRAFKKVRCAIQNLLFGSARERLIRQTRQLVPRGTLLDIGCGKGVLLDVARKYYDCEGLEPSATAAELARAKGYRILESTIEDAQVDAGRYDVVTLDAVLEHLTDPLATLTKVNHLLRVGGVVVIKVPKLWGPTHRRHGREWNGFRVGYHTVMFTGPTLSHVLRQSGFEPADRPQRDRPLDDILVLWGRKVRDVSPLEPANLRAA